MNETKEDKISIALKNKQDKEFIDAFESSSPCDREEPCPHNAIESNMCKPYCRDCGKEIEHCNDAPDCPECSMLAYNKGREDMRLEIDSLIHNHTFDCDKVGTSVRELRTKIKNIK